MTLQYCQLLHSTHFTHKLQCAKVSDCFSSFSLWVDKGTLRCGNNFWSDLLCSIALVVKVFNVKKYSCYLTGTCSKKWEVTYSLLDGMKWLAAFIQLRKAWLTCIHSPSTMVVSHRLPKNGKQTRWMAKEASKAFYGYPWGGESGKW